MRLVASSFAVAAVCAFAGSAQAHLEYMLTDSLGVPRSSFTIGTVGGFVDIRLYIAQDGGHTELDAGLVAAGVRLSYDNPTSIARVMTTADITPNPEWDGIPPALLTADGLSARVNMLDLTGVLPVDNRILLGTMRLTGTGLGTVSILAGDPDPLFDDTATKMFEILDGELESITARVTVTPAPASVVALSGLLVIARRRR